MPSALLYNFLFYCLIGYINVIILVITVACLFAQGPCFCSTYQNILVLTSLCFSGLCQFHSSFCTILICLCFISLNCSKLYAMTMILLLVDLSFIREFCFPKLHAWSYISRECVKPQAL